MKSPLVTAQESSWYCEFLAPVVNEIVSRQDRISILDIGTGPGKLPEILISRNEYLKIKGIDIDKKYVEMAQHRVNHLNVKFYLLEDMEVQFGSERFDVITFCSVLFLLEEEIRLSLFNKALHLLKPGGTIIVLTPSGRKNILSAFSEVWCYPKSIHNWTFILWRVLTHSRGNTWRKQQWLKSISNKFHLDYESKLVFNGNATIEILKNLT